MRYSAFISYTHTDRRWAIKLHRALETYRIPKRLQGKDGRLGTIGAKLPPVFRDREELAASADLASAVRAALDEAATLIVICSPAGARSRWVNEEIRYFSQLGRRADVRCVIIAGEPGDADPDRECLPPALLEGDATEPLAVDLRPGQDGLGGGSLKLIASILGVSFDELRQREAQRRTRRLAILATASTLGFIFAAGLAIFAWLSRNEAVAQRNLAIQRTMTAERTTAFVRSMFETSDPSQAKGEKITAREVLDRGARQIRYSLQNEPAVRADLAVTLGSVYESLGLYGDADRLLRWSWALPHGQPDIRAAQLTALGDVRRATGDYAGAVPLYQRAVTLMDGAEPLRIDLRTRALASLGQAYTGLEQYREGEGVIRQALAIDTRLQGAESIAVARDLEALGRLAVEAGQDAKAEPLVRRALAIRRAREGELSPSVSDNLSTLGSIAYARGDLVAAERLFASRLSIDERVLGADHPDVATLRNNIARIMLEHGNAAGALPMLERAVADSVHERGPTYDQMAFLYGNLGIAYRELGRLDEAADAFAHGAVAARIHRHRNLAPDLADLALTRCLQGRTAAADPLIAEARPLMHATYQDQPWRDAWVDTVAAVCLEHAGKPKAAAGLLARAAGPLTERWPPGALYRTTFDRLRSKLP